MICPPGKKSDFFRNRKNCVSAQTWCPHMKGENLATEVMDKALLRQMGEDVDSSSEDESSKKAKTKTKKAAAEKTEKRRKAKKSKSLETVKSQTDSGHESDESESEVSIQVNILATAFKCTLVLFFLFTNEDFDLTRVTQKPLALSFFLYRTSRYI